MLIGLLLLVLLVLVVYYYATRPRPAPQSASGFTSGDPGQLAALLAETSVGGSPSKFNDAQGAMIGLLE